MSNSPFQFHLALVPDLDFPPVKIFPTSTSQTSQHILDIFAIPQRASHRLLQFSCFFFYLSEFYVSEIWSVKQAIRHLGLAASRGVIIPRNKREDRPQIQEGVCFVAWTALRFKFQWRFLLSFWRPRWEMLKTQADIESFLFVSQFLRCLFILAFFVPVLYRLYEMPNSFADLFYENTRLPLYI